MIMQTNMQTIGLRNKRLSSLVNRIQRPVVDKRPTMQSSKQYENTNKFEETKNGA